MARGDQNPKIIPTDLAEEYAEIGVEKLIKEGSKFVPVLDELGSEIPYVKTLIAAIKFPITLSDVLLGKKVNSFLYTSGLDADKLAKFKKKFSKVKQERLWEQIVFSINSHDDKFKSEIIGKLFSALVDEAISEAIFFTLVHATNSLNIHLLDHLKEQYMLDENASLTTGQYYSFATLGLLDIDNSSIGSIGGGGPRYSINQTGWIYLGIVYDYPATSIKGVQMGKDNLITELSSDNQITGKAYPLKVLIEKGSKYREVDLFSVNKNDEVLCESKSGLPIAIGSKIVGAGMYPNLIAEAINDSADRPVLSILSRIMEDVPIHKLAYATINDDNMGKGTFRAIQDINVSINQVSDKNDKLRYLNELIVQIERHTTGELIDEWNKFKARNPDVS